MLNEKIMNLVELEEEEMNEAPVFDPSEESAKSFVMSLLNEAKTKENRSTIELVQNLLFDENLSVIDWRSIWQLLSVKA